ncbi:hypothetical protein [Methanosarcina siciliae]|uniref:hypothetical protein n=1 Tax=Methanosarcina siciliae TaxID=38027 RepID=UPI0012DFF739|nr:hypothetical protein [Methanosarcina siciliae]
MYNAKYHKTCTLNRELFQMTKCIPMKKPIRTAVILEAEVLNQLDEKRGDVPRVTYIRNLVKSDLGIT